MTVRKSPGRTWLLGLTVVLTAALAAVAAVSATASPKAITLNVLVDQTRSSEVQAYASAHPGVNIKVNILTTDPLTELRLALKAKSNVPDVVFDSGPTTYAGQEFQIYAGDLTKYISTKTLAKYVRTSNTNCHLGAKLLCIRNDLAQNVLWVNTHLFQKFGYKVPQTWQQFEQLGLKVATEHPGYYIGPMLGWIGIMDSYFGAFQCPFNQVIDSKTVRINTHAAGCLRMYATLDPLLKAGVLGKLGVFDTGTAALVAQDKFLMMLGPSWWGDHILEPFYNAPKGEWTANQPMAWGKNPRVTSAAGGGVWMMYRSTPHPKEAAAFIVGMTTDLSQAASKPTYPSYGPAVAVWTAHVAADPFYSRSPVTAFNQAAAEVTTTPSFARYDYTPVYNTIMDPGLQAGKSLASMANSMQAALVKLARQAGYKVVS